MDSLVYRHRDRNIRDPVLRESPVRLVRPDRLCEVTEHVAFQPVYDRPGNHRLHAHVFPC